VAQSDIQHIGLHNTSIQMGIFDRSTLTEKKDGVAEASVKMLQCEQCNRMMMTGVPQQSGY